MNHNGRNTDDPKMQSITLRLNDDMRVWAENQAMKEGIAISAYIRELIQLDMMGANQNAEGEEAKMWIIAQNNAKAYNTVPAMSIENDDGCIELLSQDMQIHVLGSYKDTALAADVYKDIFRHMTTGQEVYVMPSDARSSR